MADLKTDYKDDVLDTSVNTVRKYNMIQNDDGTVSFEDVTVYLQEGDNFGAQEINQINAGLEELKKSVSDGKAMVASAITEKLEVETATDASFETMANNILNSNLEADVTYASGNTVTGGSDSETKSTSVALSKGKYIVCWTSYSCTSSGWQSHSLSVSGGTYSTLKQLQFACSTDTCYSTCYLVEITSSSGTVTGSYKRQSDSTRTAVGALHAVKVS